MSTATSRPDAPVPARVVRAWGLWDFGEQAFHTVILTFVFSVYLTSAVAADPTHGATVFSSAQTWAGIVMAVLAPALGSWGDRVRSSKLMLTITTLGAIICTALLWFTKPEDGYLLYGAVVIAVGGLFVELAGVFLQRDLVEDLHAGNLRPDLRVRLGNGVPRRCDRPCPHPVRVRLGRRVARAPHRERGEFPRDRPALRGLVPRLRSPAAHPGTGGRTA